MIVLEEGLQLLALERATDASTVGVMLEAIASEKPGQQ